MTKTIFITSFNPFIARNILATDVFKTLRAEKKLRIVVFVPDYKVSWFSENLGGGNATFVALPISSLSTQDVFFTYLGSSLVRSRTLAIHKREKLLKDGGYLRFLISWFLRAFFGGVTPLKKFIRGVDFQTIKTTRYAEYFKEYSPALVFATDVFNNEDVHFLAAARRFKVTSVGMIRSWDNVTTKGMFRMVPDRLVVNNEIIKQEVLKHNCMSDRNVFVGGIPQYDEYVRGVRISRRDFMKRIGFDPNKKMVLFSPFGDRFFSHDWELLTILEEVGAQILVRLTPNDQVSLERLARTPFVYIDRPGHQFTEGNFRDAELTSDDLRWLADSLYHSDVVVAGGASIGLDAAVFDKPAIFAWFDGFGKEPYLKSARRWFDFDHVAPLLAAGGVRIARNKDELIAAVKDCLADPNRNREQRNAMLLEQAYRLDGRAGERIGRFIVSLIN